MGSAVFWIEGVLVGGVMIGWAVWEYFKTSKELEKTRADEAAAKAKDAASETEASP